MKISGQPSGCPSLFCINIIDTSCGLQYDSGASNKVNSLFMKPLHTLLLAGAMLLSLPSCSTRIASFSVASTRNFDFTATGNYQVSANKVSNMDGEYTVPVLFFSTFSEADMTEAVEGAIREAGPGCIGISDATLRRGYLFTGIVNASWYSVEGNPIYRR